jgi:hypothetical protein
MLDDLHDRTELIESWIGLGLMVAAVRAGALAPASLGPAPPLFRRKHHPPPFDEIIVKFGRRSCPGRGPSSALGIGAVAGHSGPQPASAPLAVTGAKTLRLASSPVRALRRSRRAVGCRRSILRGPGHGVAVVLEPLGPQWLKAAGTSPPLLD